MKIRLFFLLATFTSGIDTTLDEECQIDGVMCDVTEGNDNCTSTDTCNRAEEELNGVGSGIFAESSYTPPKKNHSRPAPESTATSLASDLGEVQQLDATYSNDIYNRIEEARDYVQSVVNKEERYAGLRHLCKNKHTNCAFWSVLGECENNPGYMQTNCAPVCKSCDMLHVETRCPLDPNAVDAFQPGGINKMFENIISTPEFEKYEPVILSQPPEGPWMIMFDNMISAEEADTLIELGGIQGYERSADVGARQDDGSYDKNVNSGRTSTNAWCVGDCYEDPVPQRVMERIENITGIPETNQENLQLLQYQPGQYYQRHSDYIPHHTGRQCGVRTLTFYIYLNDVEEGGGTAFPAVQKTVMPKRGRAVLWPSVLDENPNQVDPRTEHTALKVEQGVKYGANAWIHMRDFKTPNANGCV